MSDNQRARTTSVVFLDRHGSSMFSTPLQLPPVPYPLDTPQSVRSTTITHVIVGLLTLMGNTAVAPIERVHLLMQNQNEMIKSGCLTTPYKGVKDCFLRTIKQEGIISLWRGNSMNVFKAFSSQALAIAIIKNSWHNEAHNKNNMYGDLKFEAAVSFATLLRYPLDYARTRLATDVRAARGVQFSLDSARKNLNQDIRSRQFRGMFDVYSKTLKMDGILGLYRGYYLSIFGMLAWEFTKKKVEEHYEAKEGSITSEVILYSLPVALYPVTTVSRRMMMDSVEATPRYKNSVHAFREIVKQEGFCSLYKGVTAGMTLCFGRIAMCKAINHLVPLLVGK